MSGTHSDASYFLSTMSTASTISEPAKGLCLVFMQNGDKVSDAEFHGKASSISITLSIPFDSSKKKSR
jgi:hypothetical protein